MCRNAAKELNTAATRHLKQNSQHDVCVSWTGSSLALKMGFRSERTVEAYFNQTINKYALRKKEMSKD